MKVVMNSEIPRNVSETIQDARKTLRGPYLLNKCKVSVRNDRGSITVMHKHKRHDLYPEENSPPHRSVHWQWSCELAGTSVWGS